MLEGAGGDWLKDESRAAEAQRKARKERQWWKPREHPLRRCLLRPRRMVVAHPAARCRRCLEASSQNHRCDPAAFLAERMPRHLRLFARQVGTRVASAENCLEAMALGIPWPLSVAALPHSLFAPGVWQLASLQVAGGAPFQRGSLHEYSV